MASALKVKCPTLKVDFFGRGSKIYSLLLNNNLNVINTVINNLLVTLKEIQF